MSAAGSRHDRRRLAVYLRDQWPELPHDDPIMTAIWLLEYLRRIEMSGVLPMYDDTGQLVPTVGTAAIEAGLAHAR